jgi:hypothetical protein
MRNKKELNILRKALRHTGFDPVSKNKNNLHPCHTGLDPVSKNKNNLHPCHTGLDPVSKNKNNLHPCHTGLDPVSREQALRLKNGILTISLIRKKALDSGLRRNDGREYPGFPSE